MKAKLTVVIALIFMSFMAADAQAQDTLHTPKPNSAEREAILRALRGNQNIKFKVHYLKVSNNWAWIDVTPLDAKGRAIAEGGPSLLRLEGKVWKILDLGQVPLDPDNPMGAEDVSPVYLANLRKTFPGVPSNILPKPAR